MVIDTRRADCSFQRPGVGPAIRRRYECPNGHRFTSYEQVPVWTPDYQI